MFAARLHGVEILHPDVKGNMTVLWCKNDVKRDVSVIYALSAVLDDIAAGGARRNQQPLPAQIDVFELATQHSGNLVYQLTESAQRPSQYLLYFLSLCRCSQNSLSGSMLVVRGQKRMNFPLQNVNLGFSIQSSSWIEPLVTSKKTEAFYQNS